MNTIKPGSIKKINQSNMAFKMMENIENFLRAAENYGCKKIDIFQVVDLYERQNMTQVVNGIYALGRVVSLGTFQSEQKLEIGFYYMIILTNLSLITNSKIIHAVIFLCCKIIFFLKSFIFRHKRMVLWVPH